MLSNQRPRSIAERDARMHRVRGKQAAGQSPLTARVEQPSKFLEIDCDALLVSEGACRANGENTQHLRPAIEGRDQVPIDFVRRETLSLVRAEMPVCDEDGALTDSCIRNQIGIDPHGDVKADVLGISQHQTAQIEAVGRCGGNGLWLPFHGRISQNFMGCVEDGVFGIGEEPLAAGAKKPRGHWTHLLASTEGFQEQQLGFELFETRQIEIRCLGVGGELPRALELAPDASLDRDGPPFPSRLGVLSFRDTVGEPLSLGRVAMSRRADEEPRRTVQAAQRNVELGTKTSTRAFREAVLRVLRAHFAHLSRV